MGLKELAEECGITTHHVDGLGREVHASDAAMMSILRALGVPIESPEDAERLREERRNRPLPMVEPCVATKAWSDSSVEIRGEGEGEGAFEATLTLEDGEQRHYRGQIAELPHGETGRVLHLGALPVGYHILETIRGEQSVSTHLISAPRQAHGAPDGRREWGVFAPLYALKDGGDWGVGDFALLRELMRWVGDKGGAFVGTLPLLAANYREDLQTSPYSPVSRLFWNELYLDLESLADRYPSAPLKAFLSNKAVLEERVRLSSEDYVDYEKVALLKRQVLELIAQNAWKSDEAMLLAYLDQNPELERYANFRSVMERKESSWQTWSDEDVEAVRSSSLRKDAAVRYHAFAQWAANQQLAGLGELPSRLYLDLSVGVSGASFDVWRYQEEFVTGVDVGAPPDGLFEGGQNWALPPLHPDRSRANGHAYFRQCIREHMRHAGILRIDHVMGLHRLYWVPSDLGATEGLYVSYPAEELYAILLIESQRQQCALAGEDLGTVPDYVRPAMTDAGIHRLFVGQFDTEWREHEQHLGLQTPSASAIASIDTHDTATFAGWFGTTDLQVEPMELMRSWTEELAAGPAAGLIINLEDLWLEEEPQNRPGTGLEVPNWRHRMARSFTQIVEDGPLSEWLDKLHGLRSTPQGVN